jgi:EAL domain-containing protein (putative c-di-GMP-specific phosphodiesterase class I)
VEVVQLLVRFAGRVGAQFIATGVRDTTQQHLLARNGVELFCGEVYARADTRLPQVTFAE